jgi:hypothetical protein
LTRASAALVRCDHAIEGRLDDGALARLAGGERRRDPLVLGDAGVEIELGGHQPGEDDKQLGLVRGQRAGLGVERAERSEESPVPEGDRHADVAADVEHRPGRAINDARVLRGVIDQER